MFRHKIKTLAELVEAVGRRPRPKSVIMCHGVFDIVHPGHLRHLMYAKQKADILVASVTADTHILKADHRPYIPQELRAENLAALEMVDYVIVDPNPTPIEHIKVLQPDYFAKGYEYFAGGVPPKTQEEMSVLEAYGGEIVFTPGDVVYSSSKLIELEAPKIAIDKLLSVMDSEGVGFADLHKALKTLETVRVHVVGDTIVDGYSDCTLLGAAAKIPAFSVKLEQTERYTGGAGIVARHLRSAGAQVAFSTVLGEDELKDFALKELTTSGVVCRPVIDRTRPTTYKERFATSGQKLLQVDRVDNRPISERVLRTLCDSLHTVPADVVIMSDFRHGIFNRDSIGRLVGEIAPGRDPQLHAEVLKEDRHEVRDEDDEEEGVSVLGAALEVSRPIARIHVADGDQIAGTEEGEQLPAHRPGRAGGDRAEHLRQRWRPAGAPPAAFRDFGIDRLIRRQ